MRYSHKLNGRMNESDRLIINLLINGNLKPWQDTLSVDGTIMEGNMKL